ncbi:S24 family peptidase [Pseudomonas syringae pv. actinidifoliorum]|uniref:S24 family peptidase n=1 Tax=Pseudomonas syringae TaxID=317 RepID=UPI002364B168|nr:S24 family peptidase [Pseudomonas syringae]MDU8429206.1 S24 family peptidase [Pseudomonas syringae pv. actinidifoliorum]MBL3827595.1 LexA family transcriptional regulator [Pseudomonas syringae pv. theae]MBL3866839.1 LexA family transcriptional regulator [Pseudomonas syringae pv. theae]MDU8520031.1 S24 family peptidase [Pseudomonas syringae pv. actinidifoliorum]MDU8526992.1 S24 family peptidase [Pseudomonas syringae pv. actinidifoliorum]
MNITDRMTKLVLARKPETGVRGVKRLISTLCGVSYEAVRQWFAEDTGNIKNDNLLALARGLDTTVDWLLDGIGEPPRRNAMNNVVQGDFPRHRRDDEIDIPQYDVVASMGPGQVRPKEYIETVRNITVRTEYLREQGITYTTGDNLSVITGFGESMGATFSSGDPLIVDQGVNEVVVDGVYVFTLDGMLYIKRLQRLPKMLRMISDNETFPPYDIKGVELETIVIHARVLLAWNAKKL